MIKIGGDDIFLSNALYNQDGIKLFCTKCITQKKN